MTWIEGDYTDYLNGLGWLENKPMPPYPRSGFIGETVYAEEWADLMQQLDEDGYNAPNSMLATVLSDLPTPITQRHATICASVMCWLGTACGQSIILNGKHYADRGEHRCNAYLLAWTIQNQRTPGGNGGFRILERLLAPPDHYGKHFFLGHELMRQPDMSADDYETAEHLMVWLGERGEGFILRCERRIRELQRFEDTKREAKHRADMKRLGLAQS